MRQIGLDVHQKRTTVAWIDSASGEMSKAYNCPTTELVAHLAAMPDPKRVAMEVGAVSLFVARQLKSLGIEVLVVDAFKGHRLLEAMQSAKTDRLDATRLAHLLAAGVLEGLGVWVPDERTSQLRTLTRTREQLVGVKTQLANAVRALIRSAGQDCPHHNLLGPKAQSWLQQFVAQQPLLGEALVALGQSLEAVAAQVDALEQHIGQAAAADERAQRLQAMSGCGALIALTVVAEIGDVRRFEAAKHLRSYAGLAPQVKQSGERCWTGPLPLGGNRHLRRALVLWAQHVAWPRAWGDTRLKKRYYRCLHRHGPNPAKIVLARGLCDIIFAMLRDATAFELARVAA